jgi:RecA/RadA recombinase
MKKNVASQKVGCQMITAADGTDFTGAVTVEVTIDAGSQATGTVGSGAATHEGTGYHTYAPAQAETNGDLVAFTFHGTGAITATVQIYTAFPQTVDNATNIAAILDDTGTSGVVVASLAANSVTAAALAADAGAEIADAVLNRDMSTGTDSGSTTVRTMRQALRFLRNKWAVSAGTLTVYKEDDSTSSWTASVSSDAAAEPVIGSDPAGP